MDEKKETMEEIEMEAEEGNNSNTLMAILAYIGPLVILAYLVAKDDTFVKFHVGQGAVLFIGEVALWFLMMTFWFLFPVWQVVNIGIFILAVIGIINAVQGKEKELPLVGKYSKHIPL